jgi:hypothetical protein
VRPNNIRKEGSRVSERNFDMRLRCRYEGNDNKVSRLEVERLVEGEWRVLELGIMSAGFDIFVYSVLTCQHMYFRVNCAERGLVLDSAEGSVHIGTDADWKIDTLVVSFSGRLGSGAARPEDIDYIVARMKQCPVSRNLREVPGAESSIELN